MTREIEFLSPRFVGARFAGHSIPLEVLKDLAVFEEMVGTAARLLYLQEHPDRARVPKGFYEGVSIVIKDIDEGSAIPKLFLVFSTSVLSLLPPENQRYLEKARDSIIQAVDAAEHDENISSVPEPVLAYFDRFGRSLKDGENIEFRPSNTARPARLNKRTRKQLILASAKVQDYTEEIEITGKVRASDHDREMFMLELRDGTAVSAPKDRTNNDVVLAAHASYYDGQKVNVKGVGRFGRNGKLQSIETVEQITPLDKLDIAERLKDLRLLENGWYNGLGEPLDSDGLTWLEEAFLNNYDDSNLPLPRLFPTVEGNVQAEWSTDDWEVSLEIYLKEKRGEYQAVQIASNQQVDEKYDLSTPESWNKICESLLKIQEGTV